MASTAAQVADLVLVDRCLEGDAAAHRELFRTYQRRVHGTLYRILGSNRDMDDLLQEAFLQVFKSLARFRGDARLSTWIDRITARVAYRYLSKKRASIDTVELVDSPLSQSSPSEQASAREGVRRLYAVLSEMAPAARIAFVLHEISGKSVAEVAACVGSTTTATKVRIWRTRRTLLRRASEDPFLRDLLTSDQVLSEDGE